MTATATPPVRRRLLGAALRRYREGLGYGLEDAARILECDKSKVSRIETGQRGIRDSELRELLTEYGVAAGEQESLAAVAHHGRRQGWWQEYQDVLTEAGQDYVIMEGASAEILGYQPHRVPALLQTADYARAVADADPALYATARRDHAVEVTLARQQVVLRERRPRLDMIVGEGALHQTVGDADAMRVQLARLATIADHGPDAGITLRVLPFTAGAHGTAACAMTVLRFAGTAGIGVIHLDALSGGVSLDGPEELGCYLRAFAELRLAALTPEDSACLLKKMAGK